MQTHTVRAGECLASIALQYNLDWQTVYNAPENQQFRLKRPNPNVIYPGDEIVIPDPKIRTDDADTDKRHVYKLKNAKWVFRMEAQDDEGNPIYNEPFELLIGNASPFRGSTDANGLIEVAVDPEAREATLRFLGEEYSLNLGMLDPVSRTTGIQARLNNLGFDAGPVDGIVGPQTRKAVYAFQQSQGLKVTGDLDDDTRKRLLKLHDNDDRCVAAEDEFVLQQVPLKTQAPPATAARSSPASEGDEEWMEFAYGHELPES